jgi:hypothetical protein
MTLTASEKKESMFVTWGRVRERARSYSNDERLKNLIEKLNSDMGVARIEENYFGKGGELDQMFGNPIESLKKLTTIKK